MADVITFDSEYMREQAQNVGQARELIAQAIERLDRARRSDGWYCPERDGFNERLGQLASRLRGLSEGLDSISSTLNSGAARFGELESWAEAEERTLARTMRDNNGSSVSVWGTGQSVTQASCQIPDPGDGRIASVANLGGSTGKNSLDLVEIGRVGAFLTAQLLGGIARGLGNLLSGGVFGLAEDLANMGNAASNAQGLVKNLQDLGASAGSGAAVKEILNAAVNSCADKAAWSAGLLGLNSENIQSQLPQKLLAETVGSLPVVADV